MSGLYETRCKVPCLRTFTSVDQGMVSYLTEDVNTIYMGFDTTIKRSEVTVDQLDFLISLNYLGSNLGLWPGLGLFQIMNNVIMALAGWQIIEKITIFIMG